MSNKAHKVSYRGSFTIHSICFESFFATELKMLHSKHCYFRKLDGFTLTIGANEFINTYSPVYIFVGLSSSWPD